MERITISTKANIETGTLPLNVDGEDHDINFEFTTLQEFKKAVQLSVKARDIYLELREKKGSEDPVGMLDGFEAATQTYREVLKILLGEAGYKTIISLIGAEIPSTISQVLIKNLGELYSKHFMKFTMEYLNTEGKL